MRPLLAAGPVVLALLAGACSETEDLTDYLADLASYIEDDAEIFGADVVPGADEPYRTLNEVPDEAPAVSSPEERAGVIRGLVADREKAQHTPRNSARTSSRTSRRRPRPTGTTRRRSATMAGRAAGRSGRSMPRPRTRRRRTLRRPTANDGVSPRARRERHRRDRPRRTRHRIVSARIGGRPGGRGWTGSRLPASPGKRGEARRHA